MTTLTPSPAAAHADDLLAFVASFRALYESKIDLPEAMERLAEELANGRYRDLYALTETVAPDLLDPHGAELCPKCGSDCTERTGFTSHASPLYGDYEMETWLCEACGTPFSL